MDVKNEKERLPIYPKLTALLSFDCPKTLSLLGKGSLQFPVPFQYIILQEITHMTFFPEMVNVIDVKTSNKKVL